MHWNNNLIRTPDFQIFSIQDHSLLNASSYVWVQVAPCNSPIIVVSSGGKVPILPSRQGHSVYPKAINRQECHMYRQHFLLEIVYTLRSMYKPILRCEVFLLDRDLPVGENLQDHYGTGALTFTVDQVGLNF